LLPEAAPRRLAAGVGNSTRHTTRAVTNLLFTGTFSRF
jgi:hypothetical protein